MGLPAKRRTKQSKRERASHFALKKFTLSVCSHCKRKIRPHVVCQHCGYYKGRQVLKITSKVEKRAKKAKVSSRAKSETTEPKKAETKKTA
jgi:large subunit ribosomal protein L32